MNYQKLKAKTAGAPITFIIMGICLIFAIWYEFNPQISRDMAVLVVQSYLQPWRLIASAFAHYGVTHFLLNMWALYLFGPTIERSIGSLRFAGLYLFTAFGSAVFVEFTQVFQISQPSYTAGASGAIFGLFSVVIVLWRRLHTDVRGMLTLLAINFAYGFVVGGVSWEGHLGGIIFGAIYAAVVLLITPDPAPPTRLRYGNQSLVGAPSLGDMQNLPQHLLAEDALDAQQWKNSVRLRNAWQIFATVALFAGVWWWHLHLYAPYVRMVGDISI
ncbi:hypothetical protein BK816_00070 [Boudabousia tangfeifanii]|uniref:Peptidase S54 rhomboid domain-containing protein n=1 Tax=Boudabousia tangfeifanii TaxID=1912795 RepID=A0A1D9MI69_9ACTO|nr:rhomboid family intramembrane serine protease [Boudabousia tangfeifanii]AOZ71879.1 hypothetical protein BK816_00070 [Boudabousia tangfeifanii]